MDYHTGEHQKQKGFLVLDAFPISILPATFIAQISPPGEAPAFIPAKWRKPGGETIAINLAFAKYTSPAGTQVCFFRFPEAIDRAFGLEALEAPIQILGFLVFVDIDTLLSLDRKIPQEYSAIHWAGKYRLPIILAVTHANKIEMDPARLSQYIDYSPDMPVVWAYEGIDLAFVQQLLEIIDSYL